jgi:putative Mn2+ efflux pump MntP
MFELIFFSVLLNIDTFSAAFTIGFLQFSPRRLLAYSFSSFFVGGAVTAIGFAFGTLTKGLFVTYEHVFACVLLILVGFHMCWEAYHHNSVEISPIAQVRCLSSLRIASISTITSLDNLVIGFSLGMQGKSILHYSLSIGVFAFISTWLGTNVAKSLPESFGARLEIVGGLILVADGISAIFH